MLDAVKRYATRILLIHLALFVLVIFFVAAAARQVQLSAREQAQLQTQERLELLAQQTARGLQSHYDSILSDLEVVLREASTTTSPASGATTVPVSAPVAVIPPPAPAPAPPNPSAATQPSPRGNRANRPIANIQGARGRGRGGPVSVMPDKINDLSRQLKDRVLQIIVVNTTPDVPEEERIRQVLPESTFAEAQERIHKSLPWLQSLTSFDTAAMGSFILGPIDAQNNQTGYHLVAIPTRSVSPQYLPGRGGPGRGAGSGRGGAGGGGGGGGRGGTGADRGGAMSPPPSPGDMPARGNEAGPGGRGNFGRGNQGGEFGGRGGAGNPENFGGRGGPPEGGDVAGGGGRAGTGAMDGQGGMLYPPGQFTPGTQAEQQFAVVAVVPIDAVREQFLEHLVDDQRRHDANAILLNDTGDILVASNLNAVGTNLLAQLPKEIRDKVEPLLLRDGANPIVIDKPFQIGSTTIEPQIISAARFEMPSGRHWTVLIGSSVAEAETIVDSVLKSALVWVTFFSLAVTALLVSTSAFLIRSRVRFERMRHDVLARELEQARHIQLAWLPDLKTAPQGLDVSAANLPASHISGDFYNWFPLPRNVPAPGRNAPAAQEHDPNAKIAIVIGDVTGHGMAAAFLMATTQLLVRMTLSRWHDPARCLRDVNQQLCTQGFRGQFVTMLVIILDPLDNTIEVATAGHPAPLLERANGTFESLDLQPQLVLGVDPAEEYRSQSFILEPGASLLLYTDGVIEAETDEGEQFGTDRLIQSISGAGNATDPAARIKFILQAIERFRGKRDLLDDLTLVALRTAPSAVPSYAQ